MRDIREPKLEFRPHKPPGHSFEYQEGQVTCSTAEVLGAFSRGKHFRPYLFFIFL